MFSVILCDIDEIILEWHNSFRKWISLRNDFYNLCPIGIHRTLESWLNIDKETVIALIEEFNGSSDFMDLKPYSHALEYIPKIHNQGFKFIAITSCGSNKWIHNVRWHNLQRYFPKMFIGLHCVELGSKKTDFLKIYKPAIWVEDNFSHAIDGANYGHQSFLFDYPHNAGLYNSLVSRVNNWQDIYNLIQE
jgi:FMN phosphatase YigB (HAD superfamily)